MANARLEIILDIQGTRFMLDTSGVDTIPITFNVQDIRDITSTQGSYSKSIVVPETTNNRKVFNNITDLNSSSSFDANLRNRAYILVDSQLVMEGYFQLTEFTIDKNMHKNGMTLVVYSDNNDFYTLLGEDFLIGNDDPNNDLDLSALNHIWNFDNIVSSWGTLSGANYIDREYTWGYYYPLIDYGYDWSLSDINGTNTTFKKLPDGSKQIDKYAEVQLEQLKPALYARVIFDAIFKQVGFKYNSNSLPLVGFNQMIIPFNNKTIARSSNQLKKSVFRAGGDLSVVYLKKDYWFSKSSENGSGNTVPDSTVQSNNETDTIRAAFSDTTTDPNGDPYNVWNTTKFEYTNNTGEPLAISFGFYLKVQNLLYYTTSTAPRFQIYTDDETIGTTYDNAQAGYPFKTDSGSSDLYTICSSDNGWFQSQTASMFGLKKDMTYGSVHYNAFEIWEKKFMTEEITLQAGAKVWLVYTYTIEGTGAGTIPTFPGNVYHDWGWDLKYNPPKPHWYSKQPEPIFKLNAGTPLAFIESSSYIFSQPATDTIVGQTIDMNSIIPQQVKKRDFILSIIKMFNLVVEPDKNSRKSLNIETRDYYYSHGRVKDWSKKVDLNDQIESIVIGDTQNKRIILKYRDDKDYYNDYYTKSYNQSFGQFIFNNPNEFVVGDNVMELQFSPTPITTLGKTFIDPTIAGATNSGIIIPKIEFFSNNSITSGTSNMRILYKKWVPLEDKDRWYLNPFGTTGSSHVDFIGYPYSGYLDDPYSPTKDLNYGQVYPAFPETNTTLNTLYYAYWKSQLEEMVDKDSRIVTASFYLTPEDIVDFKFSDTIFLDFGDGGQYYRVNKITDYDPVEIRTCRVELFRTKNVKVPIPITQAVVPAKMPTKLVKKATPWKPVPYWHDNNFIDSSYSWVNGADNYSSWGPSFINGFNNESTQQFSMMNGSYNVTSAANSFVNGSNNFIAPNSPDAFISGDFNSVEAGSFVTVFGSNNTIKSVANLTPNNVFVLGDNLTVTEPNRIYLAQPTVLVNNYIEAGRDQIVDMFNENSVVNYISAGRDMVRDWGSNTTTSFISAGRDAVLGDENIIPVAKSPYTTYY